MMNEEVFKKCTDTLDKMREQLGDDRYLQFFKKLTPEIGRDPERLAALYARIAAHRAEGAENDN